MVALPDPPGDPTLEAADRALEAKENGRPPRSYLGMSGIGHPCARKVWFDWRWVSTARHNAETLKRFADGHHGEDVQAARLRMVRGVTLLTIDPATGRQFGHTDHNSHFRGHMDGAILGLLQAPKTWHVWEHKQVGEKKQASLIKLKAERGEKNALSAWDTTYYSQACLYMHYSGMTRHYLTCSTPGGRSTVSVRTDADETTALKLIAKAERIIASKNPPERISQDPSWYECRWCDHNEVCFGKSMPQRNCRTCLRSTPVAAGAWHCAKYDDLIPFDAQMRGCDWQLFIPELLADREQIDVVGDLDGVIYRLKDGSTWADGTPF